MIRLAQVKILAACSRETSGELGPDKCAAHCDEPAQPPKRIGCENDVGSTAATKLLKINDCLPAIVRIAIVNRVLLEKMPTFPLCVVKYRRVAVVRCDNQRIRCCAFSKFQTGIAKLSGRGSIKWSHIEVSKNCKRTRKQDRPCHHRNARRRDFRSDK